MPPQNQRDGGARPFAGPEEGKWDTWRDDADRHLVYLERRRGQGEKDGDGFHLVQGEKDGTDHRLVYLG